MTYPDFFELLLGLIFIFIVSLGSFYVGMTVRENQMYKAEVSLYRR